ncbi:hypothetical protein Bbelb_210090 [Branchiostoma belcheri]|nr:hypothetical protein Bbelb_210090 [Branchiostoma belcheri]
MPPSSDAQLTNLCLETASRSLAEASRVLQGPSLLIFPVPVCGYRAPPDCYRRAHAPPTVTVQSTHTLFVFPGYMISGTVGFELGTERNALLLRHTPPQSS